MPKIKKYNVVFVNGDNNLESLGRRDKTWKARLTGKNSGRLMFDVEDV